MIYIVFFVSYHVVDSAWYCLIWHMIYIYIYPNGRCSSGRRRHDKKLSASADKKNNWRLVQHDKVIQGPLQLEYLKWDQGIDDYSHPIILNSR